MKDEELIGRKVKGFKFEENEDLFYRSFMDKCLGIEGTITNVNPRTIRVQIKDEGVWYPKDEVIKQLMNMKTNTGLNIELENAKKSWLETNEEGKQLLENLLGEEFTELVKPRSIMERVKTLEDAENILGKEDEEVIILNQLRTAGIFSHIYYYQSTIVICKALNEGWQPNWEDGNESKSYPWFEMGTGFSYYNSDRWLAVSFVGSRLCFKSGELAKYAGTQFLNIYKKFMN